MMSRMQRFMLLIAVLFLLVKKWAYCQTEVPCGQLSVDRTVLRVGSNITATCYFCVDNASTSVSWEYGHNRIPADMYFQNSSSVSTVSLVNLNLTSKDGQVLTCKSESGESYSITVITGYPPEKPTDLHCLSHDLTKMNCGWNAGSDSNLEIVYEVCTGSSLKSCSNLTENMTEMDFVLFSPLNVKITSRNGLGEASEKFLLSEKDIWIQAFVPEISRLIPDYLSSTLYAEYNIIRPYDEKLMCRFEVLLTEKLEVIQESSLTSNIFPTNWTWNSYIPLECTAFSVRARCKYDDPFLSKNKSLWSDWSLIKAVQGKEPSNGPLIYPSEKVVQAGSNMTFCCIPLKGQTVTEFKYGDKNDLLPVDLGSGVKGLIVYNLNVSSQSGTNVYCILSENAFDGVVVFVGYPPDIPQNLSCETRDMKNLICTWDPGRVTGLVGQRRTNYTLDEWLSMTNKTCILESIPELYICGFTMRKGQRIYNVTLHAENPLGSSVSNLVFDVTQRVYPNPPSDLILESVQSTNVSLMWSFKANYLSLELLCQIEVKEIATDCEMRNYSMMGGPSDSSHSVIVDGLKPDSSYTFRIRCATFPIWKWSEWSEQRACRTLEALPSVGPDVWLQISGNGLNRTAIIIWRFLSHDEGNGKILSYEILAVSENKVQEHKHISVSASENSTHVPIDENEYMITVTAKNSVGTSPASSLRIPSSLSSSNGGEVLTYTADGTGDAVLIEWHDNYNVTCGYVVEWYNFPVSQLDLQWQKYLSNTTSVVIKSDVFQQGVRYRFSVYGCQEQAYQLLEKKIGYTVELAPKVQPNVSVYETTSSVVLLKWDDIPEEDLQGFLQGYMIYLSKQENTTSKSASEDTGGSEETKKRNITDPTLTTLKIANLQSGTSYKVGVAPYTHGGEGPQKINYFVTKTSVIEILPAILVPVAAAVCLGLITSVVCYRKRRWIMETCYPKIPNPEHSKALNFDNGPSMDSSVSKTMEMNPCTPNSVEVVEAAPLPQKADDTDLLQMESSEEMNDQLPEDRSDSETADHVVVSYYPPIITVEHDIPATSLYENGVTEPVTSQVIYMEVPNPEPPEPVENPAQNEDENASVGYRPQLQVPSSLPFSGSQFSLDDALIPSDGYQPQLDLNGWNFGSAESPGSTGSGCSTENVLVGSPSSMNSRQYLISEEDSKDSSKSISLGWSFPSLFHNRPDD
ncbi:leukemia inhibitory factor receptor [Protopterus annectens]|uniref:leukemia inhibitory factor receptor n=1 Tax=Protopterus annectens TaxID=7888 RepID=UPI001CF9EBD3|nr:leukemia inhibitory factor receptor [Protopterus annectens]